MSSTLEKVGIFGGRNPVEYSASNPLTLFLVQVCVLNVVIYIVLSQTVVSN